jgi:FkbM family methyltransferase
MLAKIIQKTKAIFQILTSTEYRQNRQKALAETKELQRLRTMPQNQHGSTDLLGKTCFFTDGMSFIGIKHEILDRQMYKFETSNPTPYIIDAGANIGIATLYFKKLYPKAEILAFEPDNTIFEILQKNLKHLDNITLVKKGLWKEETTLVFFSEGKEAGRIVENNTQTKNKIEIQTTKLSDYLHKKVDFLKIDIEGAELEVLEECKAHLHQVDKLFVEYHSYQNQPQHLDKLIAILKDAGFRFYIEENLPISNNPFVKINGYQDMDMLLNIFAFRNNTSLK